VPATAGLDQATPADGIGRVSTAGPEGGRARTRLDPSVRRASILDAAEKVFAGRNPADVTFEEIAEAAAVSRGLVYNYFGDKAGLIAALYLRTFERLDAAMLSSLDGHDTDGEAALRAVIGAYLRFARDNQVPWHLIGAAEATAHPVVQAARQERFRRMAAAWGGSEQALILAGGVVGFLEAATLAWLDTPATDLEAATELLLRMIWGGIANLDGTSGVRLPPHAGFDRSTFVPRGVALTDGPAG
jgi:AcrR family transcriptional regulator